MYKTSKVIIKNNLDSIEPVIEYLKAISTLVGLSEKEIQKICYGLEESLQNSILFDFEEENVEDIEIEIIRIASGMKLIISDNGIPKNPFKKVPKTLDTLVDAISFESIAKHDGDDITVLSEFVIHKLLDHYKYINKGKDGRSVEMIIYSSQKRISEDFLESKSSDKEKEEFKLIRTPLASDVTGISRLFYKSYAYSYVNDIVYYPDRLKTALDSGSLISKVALSQHERVIGHIALMQPFEDAKITEWGMAISDTAMRGQGIMSQLISEIMSDAKSSLYHGVFSHSVTNHEFTQKICTKYGFSDVALLVGYAGAELSFRNITDRLSQRESTIISYIPLKSASKVALFMPQQHQEMITKLYKGIGIDVMQKTLEQKEKTAHSTYISDTIIPALNIAEVILHTAADDSFETLQYITKKFSIAKIDIIYLYLNLEDFASINLIDKLESIGYFFGGIFPHYHHEHTLILQYINNIKFDYTLIQSYTPLAKELKEYIHSLDNNQIET